MGRPNDEGCKKGLVEKVFAADHHGLIIDISTF